MDDRIKKESVTLSQDEERFLSENVKSYVFDLNIEDFDNTSNLAWNKS